MEPASGVGDLALLVQDAAVLRDGEDVDAGGGRGDDAAAGQRSHCCARVVLPRLALVVAVCVPQIVVRHHIRRLPPRPRRLDPPVEVVEPVDVRIVVVALEVFPDARPSVGRRAVEVEVAVSGARSVREFSLTYVACERGGITTYAPMRSSKKRSFSTLSNRGYVTGVQTPVAPGRLFSVPPNNAVDQAYDSGLVATPCRETR